MLFSIQVSAGNEVVFAGHSTKDRPIYYGAAPSTGLWKLSIPKMADFLAAELASLSFGESLDEFRLGLEIAELEGWGDFFKATRQLVIYRPRSRSLVSVGQLEWTTVKDLQAADQLQHLTSALVGAIEQVPRAKRKPKSFDATALAKQVQQSMGRCDPEIFVAREQESPVSIPG